LNVNCDFTAEQVADLLEGKPEAGQALFWRDLEADSDHFEA
jgi:hypothetical protein